uniref:Uncharacterized protein n=1 Tax=Anopheles culicifacies TaxID=139723 RepID=A0A182LYI1_9DIPT
MEIRFATRYSRAEVTNNGRPMNPSLSEDSVAETALSKKNSDAGLELASVSSIPTGAGPLVATGNDLAIGGRTFLSTGGGSGGHFGGGGGGGGGPSSSRRSSFVSGIFSSAVQRRGSGNESAHHTTASVALNSNMLLNDNTSINHKHATKPTTNAAGAAAAVAAATTRTTTTTATATTTTTATTSSAAVDASEAAAHVPTMLRFGGASALPILLCGQLQKELLVQQHTNRQLSFFTQPTIDSMSYHLISTNSA